MNSKRKQVKTIDLYVPPINPQVPGNIILIEGKTYDVIEYAIYAGGMSIKAKRVSKK